MKKIITLLVALLTLLTLVSCSNGSSDEENIYNPHGYEIVAIEAGQLPLTLPDVDAAVINGNYALEAKLNETNPAIEIEAFNWETSVKRTNYLAVKGGNEESDKTKALVAAITSEEVEKYINDTYQGAVIASFIDADGKDIASAEIPEAKDDNVIKVGATLVPHAEILKNVVADILALKGWKLEVIEFNDYVLPNTTLNEGEIDANYFQTLGYLKNQNEEGGLDLVAAVGVHIEPMGLYSKKINSLSELKDGASIAVPNDTDNYARAIDLLNALGLLNNAPSDVESITKINK
ncbi:MAG: hypothetical protein IJH31_01015 [Erysipelotrichaceae bacterium]|nr:hypothetical protein [Erysipelotrichaceae bacterium]